MSSYDPSGWQHTTTFLPAEWQRSSLFIVCDGPHRLLSTTTWPHESSPVTDSTLETRPNDSTIAEMASLPEAAQQSSVAKR
jgi:hypothetical protein